MYKVVKQNININFNNLAEVARFIGVKKHKLAYPLSVKKMQQISCRGYVITKLNNHV